MIQPELKALPSGLFRDDEPVIGSHPLLAAAREPGAKVPLFGNAERWDFNGVVRRPANMFRVEWRINFTVGLDDPVWNLRAREQFMIMLNPRHPALDGHVISVRSRLFNPATVIGEASYLRRLAEWAAAQDMPEALELWAEADVKRYIDDLGRELAPSTVKSHLAGLDRLHRCGPVLSGGGLPVRATSLTANTVPKYGSGAALSTQVVAPEVWFAIVKAAWTYVHVFGPDIVRAWRRYTDLLDTGVRTTAGCGDALDAYLSDPANPIPLHRATDQREPAAQRGVNWSLLGLFIGHGGGGGAGGGAFPPDEATNPNSRRRKVHAALARGHATTYGVVEDLAEVTLPDGTTRPWHPGLNPYALKYERIMLRNAAFTLVIALSMMRDSEIHEIERDSIIEHFASPAVRSTKQKMDANLPVRAWWVADGVARAIVMAEQVCEHPLRVFGPLVRTSTSETVDGKSILGAFITHVNKTSGWSGLAPIPAGRHAPHMWRRTMAMLTDQFAGSEIALGIQLKHVAARALANRTTGAYAAPHPAWAQYLESAIDAARFRGIQELYTQHKAGQAIGYGPGADRVIKAFDRVHAEVTARQGDAAVEQALLRSANIAIRFGTLNHCTVDQRDMRGAVCVENAAVPDGQALEPLPDRCRPDRCGNAMFGPQHVPIHDANRRGLLTLLSTAKLSPCRRAVIERELGDVENLLAQIPREER